ncbi:MAG: HlyC/CorC family transporter [Candidatus Cloacimonetes bacterium]|nr:HlyC/CorC family transporter [Candidatus Cloacimonadota bacterium]
MGLFAAFLIVIIALALSFFFSGYETGVISVDRLKLEQHAKRDRKSKELLSFIEKPDRFLGTTLFGTNISQVIISSVTTFFLDRTEAFTSSLVPILLGVVVLVVGEIVPKALFRDFPDKLVPALFPTMKFFYTLFTPFVKFVTLINTGLTKVFKLRTSSSLAYLTRDDLALFLNSPEHQQSFEDPQREMIEDALEFSNLEARNIITPRTDIVAIPEDMPVDEIIELARKEGYTRYPVYRESIDNIVGVLIIYDIIKSKKQNLIAKDILHEAYFAPETMDADELLKEMQSKKKSMAIIVDSYGGTEGIVTIEDIIEEIVGNIEDEYDIVVERDVEKVGDNVWLVKGDVEVDRLIDEYEIKLPEGDYETIAGFIIDKIKRIPVQGQYIELDEYTIQILQVTQKKVIKVKITKK